MMKRMEFNILLYRKPTSKATSAIKECRSWYIAKRPQEKNRTFQIKAPRTKVHSRMFKIAVISAKVDDYRVANAERSNGELSTTNCRSNETSRAWLARRLARRGRASWTSA